VPGQDQSRPGSRPSKSAKRERTREKRGYAKLPDSRGSLNLVSKNLAQFQLNTRIVLLHRAVYRPRVFARLPAQSSKLRINDYCKRKVNPRRLRGGEDTCTQSRGARRKRTLNPDYPPGAFSSSYATGRAVFLAPRAKSEFHFRACSRGRVLQTRNPRAANIARQSRTRATFPA